MVTLARSDSPWGPYEPCPSNPILTHRNTQMGVPLQGTGHAREVFVRQTIGPSDRCAFSPAPRCLHRGAVVSRTGIHV
jgi:hypothetical protein